MNAWSAVLRAAVDLEAATNHVRMRSGFADDVSCNAAVLQQILKKRKVVCGAVRVLNLRMGVLVSHMTAQGNQCTLQLPTSIDLMPQV